MQKNWLVSIWSLQKKNDWFLCGICKRNAGLYMKCNTGLKLVKEKLWSTNINNSAFFIYPLSANPTKWSNTLKQSVANLSECGLSVFDHFKIYFRNYYDSLPTSLFNMCHALRNLAPFGEIWKREKHSQRTLVHGFFMLFKSYKCYQTVQSVSHLLRRGMVRKNACYWQNRPLVNTQPILNVH